MSDPLFFGTDFIHWFGIVEDVNDPLGLGRCRVRIVGYHNMNDQKIPTEALPWATPILPITNAAIGGIGHAPVGAKINTRVWGFFADGKTAQKPIMIGTLIGESIQETRNALPTGNPPAQPTVDPFIDNGSSVVGREGDCPSGTAQDTSAANEVIPDQRLIKISPGEWVCPTTGFISSPYGPRGGSHHNGVDICPAGYFQQTDAGAKHLYGKCRGPIGQPIYAAAAGQVCHIWYSNKGQGNAPTTYDLNGYGSRSFGNAVAIKHNLSDGPYITIYAHLGTHQDPAQDTPGGGLMVKLGDTVSAGQQIGVMGRTHNRDSLTHLHFEIRKGHTLPKASNHIDPGRVFPQMAHRHEDQIGWGNSHKYADKPPYDPASAPVIAGDGPKSTV